MAKVMPMLFEVGAWVLLTDVIVVASRSQGSDVGRAWLCIGALAAWLTTWLIATAHIGSSSDPAENTPQGQL